MTDTPRKDGLGTSQRQRVWERLLRRAARRDGAVADAQRSVERDPERYARTVWLAEEAMTLVLRMSRGEF